MKSTRRRLLTALTGLIYLQAYCIHRLAPRTFRFDRIENLTPT